jgi:hypothetical protein
MAGGDQIVERLRRERHQRLGAGRRPPDQCMVDEIFDRDAGVVGQIPERWHRVDDSGGVDRPLELTMALRYLHPVIVGPAEI